MLKGAVARRYAGAIFDLARKQNTLDRTLEDVKVIATVFANRKISYLLREPKIPAKRKEAAIRQALTGRVQPTSLNLALLLIQRELVDYMPNIANEFEQLVRVYRNEAVADVTTAMQMDDAETKAIRQSLVQRTGKTIIMRTHINPAILGGVIARVGDQVIDGSVRYRLSVLQQQLLTGMSSNDVDFFTGTSAETQVEGEMQQAVSEAEGVPAGSGGDGSDYNAVPENPQNVKETVGEGYNDVPEVASAQDQKKQYKDVPKTKPQSGGRKRR